MDTPLIAQHRTLNSASSALLGEQGWQYDSRNANAMTRFSQGITTIDTTSIPTSTYTGVSRTDQVLNAGLGFVLKFQAALWDEVLTNQSDLNGDNQTDRSALSMTVVTQDPTQAIELGFTKTASGIRIFAKDSNLLQAEGVNTSNLDLSNPSDTYELHARGNRYALLRNGMALLSGNLRNYTGSPSYQTTNLIAFSDNSAAATGCFSIGRIELMSGAIAPQVLPKNIQSNAIEIGISDLQTAAANLTFSAISQNPTLLSNSSITIQGTGAHRTLHFTPNPNQTGTGSILLSLNDGTQTTTQTLNFTIINASPQTDLILRNSSTQELGIWSLNDGQVETSHSFKFKDGTVIKPGAEWSLVSSQFDFNGDTIRDMVWFNTQTTESVIWYLKPETASSTDNLTGIYSSGVHNIVESYTSIGMSDTPMKPCLPGGKWQISAVADLLGDGKAELVWEDRESGAVAIWQLNIASDGQATWNTATSKCITLNDANQTVLKTGGAASGWRMIGIGNFDGNAATKDLLWFNDKTTETAIWSLTGTTYMSGDRIRMNGDVVKTGGNWRPATIVNLNNQGNDEILWVNDTQMAVWALNNDFTLASNSVRVTESLLPGEQIQGVMDLNGDGSLDLITRQKVGTTDTTQVYFFNPQTFQLDRTKPKQFIRRRGQDEPIVTGDVRWDIAAAIELGGTFTKAV